MSPVTIPETTAGRISAPVPFFVSKVTNSELGQKNLQLAMVLNCCVL